MSSAVIRVERLGKQYRIGHARGPRTLREDLVDLVASAVPPSRPRRRGRGHGLGAARRVARGTARRGRGHHRRKRGRQEHPAQDPVAHLRADRRLGRDRGPGRLAARGRHRLPFRAHRARERLHERRHPRHAQGGDRPQVRRDRGVRRHRPLPRHARQALFERHAGAARLRRGRAPRARDPDRRRGARGRRRGVPEEVPRTDAGRLAGRRPDRPLREPQHGRGAAALHPRRS